MPSVSDQWAALRAAKAAREVAELIEPPRGNTLEPVGIAVKYTLEGTVRLEVVDVTCQPTGSYVEYTPEQALQLANSIIRKAKLAKDVV